MIKPIITALGAALLVSCAVFIEPQIKPIPELPKQLGQYQVIKNFIGSCPDISGIYNRTPKLWQATDEQPEFQPIKASDIKYIFLFNLGSIENENENQNLPKSRTVNFNIDELQFTVDQRKIDVISRHLKTGKPLLRKISLAQNHYTCSDNFINITLERASGGGDGVSYNYKRFSRATLLDNGDLLVYQQTAKPFNIKHLYAIYKRSR